MNSSQYLMEHTSLAIISIDQRCRFNGTHILGVVIGLSVEGLPNLQGLVRKRGERSGTKAIGRSSSHLPQPQRPISDMVTSDECQGYHPPSSASEDSLSLRAPARARAFATYR